MSDDPDEVWRRDEIDSPCRKVCVIDPHTRLCVGCFRTMDEIAEWSRMAPERRRALMAELPARAPLLTKRPRRGRARRRAERD